VRLGQALIVVNGRSYSESANQSQASSLIHEIKISARSVLRTSLPLEFWTGRQAGFPVLIL
jgi:hypothetical protein